MWSNLKALPLFAKIIIACLVLAGIYQMGQLQRRSHPQSQPFSSNYGSADDGRDDAARYDEVRNGDSSSASNGSSQALAQFQSQQSQLVARMRQCQGEMTQATNQMAAAAMQGSMVNNRPPCEQYMPQWIAQESYLETEIYRIQTGDHSSSLRQITGIAAPTYDSSQASRSGGSSGSGSSDGTDAVDRWDREGIRGNSLYSDESGERHELPTRNYYFRDRSSGQMVGSDQPNPPNDGRDYEQLNYQPH